MGRFNFSLCPCPFSPMMVFGCGLGSVLRFYCVDLGCVDLSMGLCGVNLDYGDLGVVFGLNVIWFSVIFR